MFSVFAGQGRFGGGRQDKIALSMQKGPLKADKITLSMQSAHRARDPVFPWTHLGGTTPGIAPAPQEAVGSQRIAYYDYLILVHFTASARKHGVSPNDVRGAQPAAEDGDGARRTIHRQHAGQPSHFL